MRKRTSAADTTPVRFVIVTMDSHLATATIRARRALEAEIPGLELAVHVAAEWGENAAALARCLEDIGRADIIVASMLFMEEHFMPVLAALQARRESCDALVCAMSASEVMKLTRMGRFSMDGSGLGGAFRLLNRLRKKPAANGEERSPRASAGADQMRVLRRIPKILRFIPGTAQDVRAYFLTLQYWLAGSEQNIASMVRLLIDRYADGARRTLRGSLKAEPPIDYPEVGVYHPRMPGRLSAERADLPAAPGGEARGTVGLLLLRSYLLAGNTGHYDGVIAALEAEGLAVVPAFATGLDARPAIERFFMSEGRATVDVVLSATGFSLVGGPAYNDSNAAVETLSRLDVPYLVAHPVEFQSLEQWGGSERGLLPVESTIMVAIPELDGASGPMVYGGRTAGARAGCSGCDQACTFGESDSHHDMQVCTERAGVLAGRIGKLVDLRRSERAARKIACVLFNFPPNAGHVGTAAFLSVFESLHNTLLALEREGYTVEVPATVDELRTRLLAGNAARYGAAANVHARISAEDQVRRQRWLRDIEAAWGPAPGRIQSDGASIFVLGERFGNVFVGIQPAFGHEGDPMRLMFEKGHAPTHAFAAFYRWVKEDFGAHAVLHFGTHGALEFMPGKQTGMSGACWPDRLIGELPNFYLYASNNPSEGAIAKRRAAATLVSYLTPPVTQAGLYRGLADLKAMIERWRGLPPEAGRDRDGVAALIREQAGELNLSSDATDGDDEAFVTGVAEALREREYALIPHGLHVVGRVPTPAARVDLLLAVAEGSGAAVPERAAVEALVAGHAPDQALRAADGGADAAALEQLAALRDMDTLLCGDHELAGILRALDARYVPPAPGGDLLRTPSVLPTGRNVHGFDPFRIPSRYAMQDGARQAERLLARYVEDGHAAPESIALVLWGSDNLKSEGGPIAQALALLGAVPRFDSYGRLAGAELVPLEKLGRPRIDVVITLSGIFRDLLPLQIKLLAEACALAAAADEPETMNYVRKHALAYAARHGCDLETASLRVFGNAEGAYGANVNHLVENGRWDDADELAEAYTRRKGFAYGRSGRPVQHRELLGSVLADVDLTYQNLESVELGLTTIDTYFDTLGGISRAVKRAKGAEAGPTPVYVGDQTRGDGTVRTLSEQVALETHTRMLNPKWYESMLEHGYEGVRQIESHVTNTMGWSATTQQVAPWVYAELTQTFVLDPAMRERLVALNPTASVKVANRLLEACERNYWTPDESTLEALRGASEELEDRLEGIDVGIAA